jgi:malonate-semialdehyde dehydrogenase (acetylating)/methylmalonate-semialdehyde dehydrogenase
VEILNYIGGAWTRATGGDSLPVVDPATGESLGTVSLSSDADVAAAVGAAVRAFPAWRAVPVGERIEVLFRLRPLLEAHLDELAELMSREHGKTRDESAGELKRGIESITHACAMPSLMMGETLENIAAGIDCETIRQPLGVFAVVTPYNFPVMIPLWFWPFAVATGNTVVLKPSERDPLTHQRVVELAAQAGLPPGVLNVVHGDQRIVEALLDHPEVTVL